MSTALRESGRGSISARWLDQPQRVRLRRALFQIHLWLAIAIGAYVVVISVSGSAAVFRREFNAWMVPRTVPSTAGTRMTADVLEQAVHATYTRDVVLEIREPQRVDRPVSVALERSGRVSNRLFDPYTGQDLGDAYPPLLRAFEWLVDLHDNLLSGSIGRRINGVGGLLVTVLVLTGAVLWWPGRRRWRDSMLVPRPSSTRRFAWRLHSAIGFWSFALLLIWGITAVYFAFPDPFEAAIDYFDSNPDDFERPGASFLAWLVQLHFGRFGGLGVRVLWTALGLTPAALLVTGLIVWWKRVVRPRAAPNPIGLRTRTSRGRDADQSA